MLKTFNYNKNGSSKILEVFLNKRKSTQKNIASSVYKIIQDVKKNGDKALENGMGRNVEILQQGSIRKSTQATHPRN